MSARCGSALLLAWLLCGCAAGIQPLEVPENGGVEVPAEVALSFQRRAEGFYLRLAGRRFNTLETFNDPVLRTGFLDDNAFFDYYADLAQSLRDAHFERSRPIDVRIQSFVFESPADVRVQVRFLGEDNRPLRPNKTSLLRLDRWQRTDDRWTVTPGKL